MNVNTQTLSQEPLQSRYAVRTAPRNKCAGNLLKRHKSIGPDAPKDFKLVPSVRPGAAAS